MGFDMRLNTLIRRVERVRDDMEDEVRKACRNHERWIVSANKKQLKKGNNANGWLMNAGKYSRSHNWARRYVELPVDHVYLDFGGDLQDEMYVEFGQHGFNVRSNDWKQWMVDYTMETGYWPSGHKTAHYGHVFGLDAANKAKLARKIAPTLAKRVRKKLGIGEKSVGNAGGGKNFGWIIVR